MTLQDLKLKVLRRQLEGAKVQAQRRAKLKSKHDEERRIRKAIIAERKKYRYKSGGINMTGTASTIGSGLLSIGRGMAQLGKNMDDNMKRNQKTRKKTRKEFDLFP